MFNYHGKSRSGEAWAPWFMGPGALVSRYEGNGMAKYLKS
jgi:hypothetical protein